MRYRALACVAALFSGTVAQAEEPTAPLTWAESAGYWAHRTGRGVNVILDKAGLPNGLKPEDGGNAQPQATVGSGSF